MRIFYASGESPFSAISSQIWRNNLYKTLVGMGNEVFEFTYDKLTETFSHLDPSVNENKLFILKNRPKLSNDLFEQIYKLHKKQPIDLFFSYFYDSCIEIETLKKIKALGIKTINWYCNGSYQFHLVKEISPHYDWCLVPEKFRIDDYKKIGANPIYCQEAANPDIYHPYDVPYKYDVSFIGQAYGDRPKNIHFLHENGININVWGFGWEKLSNRINTRIASNLKNSLRLIKKVLLSIYKKEKLEEIKPFLSNWKKTYRLPPEIIGPPLSDENMIKIYSQSKINIGFSSCGETHKSKNRILQIRLRDFEIPMSSGFYMVEYMKDLEDFFEIGKEIVCYTDMKELTKKIRYYLNNPEEREKIRLAGHKKCLKDHTWEKRFEMVFNVTGLTNVSS